jgi:hypothetical protein
MENSVNAAKVFGYGREVRSIAEKKYLVSTLTVSYVCELTFLLFREKS